MEDDPNSRLLLQHALGSRYRLLYAVSVAEAWEHLEQHAVDLILLDLSLEGDADGLDLTCALREQKEWEHLPIIVTTAYAFTTDREKCLEAGCTEFLSKPLDLQKLRGLLEHYLPADSRE